MLRAAVMAVLAAVAWVATTWPETRDALVAEPGTRPSGVESPGPPSIDETVLGPPARGGDQPAATRRAHRPRQLTVPSLGLRSPVVRIDVADGVLTPPPDPDVVGWWRQGALVGADTGATLITGHTVHTGGGAMDDLEQLRPGDGVQVDAATGTVAYRVHRVQVLSTSALAARAPALFRQSGPGRLVLVTCEDWNGDEYESNVVVTARPAR